MPGCQCKMCVECSSLVDHVQAQGKTTFVYCKCHGKMPQLDWKIQPLPSSSAESLEDDAISLLSRGSSLHSDADVDCDNEVPESVDFQDASCIRNACPMESSGVAVPSGEDQVVCSQARDSMPLAEQATPLTSESSLSDNPHDEKKRHLNDVLGEWLSGLDDGHGAFLQYKVKIRDEFDQVVKARREAQKKASQEARSDRTGSFIQRRRIRHLGGEMYMYEDQALWDRLQVQKHAHRLELAKAICHVNFGGLACLALLHV